MATSDPAPDGDTVYRCACSWVGCDPDRIIVPYRRCPKCLGRSHGCQSGGISCRHCSDDTCAHGWSSDDRYGDPITFYANTCPACWKHDRKRVAVKPEALCRTVLEQEVTMPTKTARRPADLFRVTDKKKLTQSITSRVLRWILERGEVTASAFKAYRVALGGTELSTHSFDRYIKGKDNYHVPTDGSYAILERIVDHGQRDNARNGNVRWIGSEGDTFEDRLKNWLAKLNETEIGRALMVIERELAEDPQNPVTITWFNAILLRSNEINSSAVRLEARIASTRTDANAAQIS